MVVLSPNPQLIAVPMLQLCSDFKKFHQELNILKSILHKESYLIGNCDFMTNDNRMFGQSINAENCCKCSA